MNEVFLVFDDNGDCYGVFDREFSAQNYIVEKMYIKEILPRENYPTKKSIKNYCIANYWSYDACYFSYEIVPFNPNP